MNFIRKIVVKSYKKELIEYKMSVSGVGGKELSDFLIYSVWLRSVLQIDGVINPLRYVDSSYNEIDLEPELHAYPLMLKDFQMYIKILKKQKQTSKALVLELWMHTLRSIIRPELNCEIRILWEIFLSSNKYWDESLKKIIDEDIQFGIDKQMVQRILKLSKEILEKLPPKEILQQR
jgi:hypothetical protein